MNTHCTISLYDEATGEALASFRVEVEPTHPVGPQTGKVYAAYLVAVSPKPLVSGYDAVAEPLPDDRLQLTTTVIWPGYHPAPISLTIAAGDSLKVKLKSDPDAKPFTAEEREAWTRPHRPGTGVPKTSGVDDLWQALRTVLDARRYRDDSEIGRARRAVALLMHQDGFETAQSGVLKEVHARANAYLDQKERTLP